MAFTSRQKKEIDKVVVKLLKSRVENFPSDDSTNRNAPFHEIILKAFRNQLKPVKVPTPYLVAISSWMHGLNTSMGMSGFEQFAHIISGGEKRTFTRDNTLKVEKSQASKIKVIIRDLKANVSPDLDSENEKIFKIENGEKENALGFTADNYVETDKVVEAIELKSVRPNSGEGRGEKEKILYAKAAFKLLKPNKKILFYIGFPFDPTGTSATDFNKERFFSHLVEFKKYFDPKEVLLGPELWNHLSGEKHTMEELLETISKSVHGFSSNRSRNY